MDLLQSLIVPSAHEMVHRADSQYRDFETDLCADPRRSSDTQPDGCARDSVLSLPPVIDGNITEPIIVQADDAELSPANEQELPERSKKICVWWYHGRCNRDPTGASQPEKPCSHLHYVPEGQPDIKLSFLFPKQHKQPCGLPLCRFKDGPGPKPEREKVKTPQKKKTNRKSGKKKAITEIKQSQQDNTVAESDHHSAKKRPCPVQHRDDPSRSAKKSKISYDDPEKSDQTCFFWYHGPCGRANDANESYYCEYKHALTNPPSMVVPPPGYVHRKPCERELCPGDAKTQKFHKKSRLHRGQGDEDCAPNGGRYFDAALGSEVEADAIDSSREERLEVDDWFLGGFEEDSK